MTFFNQEQQYAYTIIKSLIDYGANYFCISPGSRNAFLTQAVLHFKACRDDVHALVHFDERGAGFHALGVAKTKTILPVLICTSGTALANFYPAIIESQKSNHPLIVLSADRLPEQIDRGENQTIPQNNIYGKFVDWEYSFAPFHPKLTVGYVYSTVQYAITQIVKNKAIIHFNLPLSRPELKPYPKPKKNNPEEIYSQTFPQIFAQDFIADTSRNTFDSSLFKNDNKSDDESYLVNDFLPQILDKCLHNPSVLILVGNLETTPQDIENVKKIVALLSSLHIPVLCDVTSSLRQYENEYFYKLYEMYLHQLDTKKNKFEMILHFGDALVGRKMNQFLSSLEVEEYYHFSFNRNHFNPHQKISVSFVLNNFLYFYKKLKSSFAKITKNKKTFLSSTLSKTRIDFLKKLTALESDTNKKIKDYKSKNFSEIDFINSFLKFSQTFISQASVSKNTCLFLGNSMPIRYFDQFANIMPFKRVYANRGASGIDGLMATATGISTQVDLLWMVVGDLSFLHDLNSLSLIQKYPIGIFLLNNQGGSIFKVLKMDKAFKEDIDQQTCKHDYDFANIAKNFSIPYAKVNAKNELEKLFGENKILKNKNFIVEILVDENDNIKEYENLLKVFSY